MEVKAEAGNGLELLEKMTRQTCICVLPLIYPFRPGQTLNVFEI
jgi:hypothetical protein